MSRTHTTFMYIDSDLAGLALPYVPHQHPPPLLCATNSGSPVACSSLTSSVCPKCSVVIFLRFGRQRSMRRLSRWGTTSVSKMMRESWGGKTGKREDRISYLAQISGREVKFATSMMTFGGGGERINSRCYSRGATSSKPGAGRRSRASSSGFRSPCSPRMFSSSSLLLLGVSKTLCEQWRRRVVSAALAANSARTLCRAMSSFPRTQRRVMVRRCREIGPGVSGRLPSSRSERGNDFKPGVRGASAHGSRLHRRTTYERDWSGGKSLHRAFEYPTRALAPAGLIPDDVKDL